MMITLAMGVGIFIPPSIGFYVSCSVSESRYEATGRAMLHDLAVLLVGVLIVAFVPWFTLAVPRLIQGHCAHQTRQWRFLRGQMSRYQE